MLGIFVSCSWELILVLAVSKFFQFETQQITEHHFEIVTTSKKKFYLIKSGKGISAQSGVMKILATLPPAYLEEELFLIGSCMGNTSVIKTRPNINNQDVIKLWPIIVATEGEVDMNKASSLLPYKVLLNPSIKPAHMAVFGESSFEQLTCRENYSVTPRCDRQRCPVFQNMGDYFFQPKINKSMKNVFYGPIFCSNFKIEKDGASDILEESNLLGLEMESQQWYEALKNYPEKQHKVCVMKGVSDHGEKYLKKNKKRKLYRKIACASAYMLWLSTYIQTYLPELNANDIDRFPDEE